MKIIKYSKQGTNKYKVYLEDNKVIILHEEVILKNELLIKKNIDNVDDLLIQNKKYEIFDISYKYLSKKSRCVKELRDYLKKHDYLDSDIERVIDELLQKGYLCDKIYSRNYVMERINLSNDGPKKVALFLEKQNISKGVYEEYLDLFTKEIIEERINKYINKMIKVNKKSKYILKNKIIFNLINLGYSKEDIDECLENINDLDDSKNYEIQKEKLYNKLKKKYSGYELDRKVKEKLYQLGYFE